MSKIEDEIEKLYNNTIYVELCHFDDDDELQPLSCPFCGHVNKEEPEFGGSGVGIYYSTDNVKAASCEECSTGFFIDIKTYDSNTNRAKLYFIMEYIFDTWLCYLKSEEKLNYDIVDEIDREFFQLSTCNYTIDPLKYPTSYDYYNEDNKCCMSDTDKDKYGYFYCHNYSQDFVKFHNLIKKYNLTYRNIMPSHDDYICDKTLFNLGKGMNNYYENEGISTNEDGSYVKLKDDEGNIIVIYHYGK